MKNLLLIIISFVLIDLNVNAQNDQEKSELRTNVDWLWQNNDNGPPGKIVTYICLVPIKDGTSLGFRGSTGKRSCGEYAVLYALVGKKEEALQWLVAGQDHNQSVKDQFRKFPDYSVSYAKEAYTDKALKSLGISSPDSVNDKLLASIITPTLPVTAAQLKAIPLDRWKLFPEDRKIPKELMKKMSPEALSIFPPEVLPFIVKP